MVAAGLGTVAPVGDPAYAGARGDLAADFATAAKLDSMFALHPAMPNTLALYQAKQALFVHAVASPYRERSHFDGQDVLESGLAGVGKSTTGWLNRATAATVPAVVKLASDIASGVRASRTGVLA